MGRYILFFLCWMVISGASASADPQDIATSNAPVIFANLKDGGNVTVHTWDRNDVQVDGDQTLSVTRISPANVARRASQPIMFWNQAVQTPEGPLSLPPEPFELPPLDAQQHEGVLIKDGGDVTINIPAGSPILVVNTSRGNVTVDNYHNGTLVSHVGSGSLRLQNVSGTVGAEINGGPFIAQNSQFDRIRVRSARGQVLFDNCTSKQIEATSLLGNIVYDRGSFDPGLARFETQRGNIALGVARGGAQVDAHSGSGQVFSEGHVGGGPVVTATSASGNVMIYNGSINEHPNLKQQFTAGHPGLPKFNQPVVPGVPAPANPHQVQPQPRPQAKQQLPQRSFPRTIQRRPRPRPTFRP